jgi:hypothetical protein
MTDNKHTPGPWSLVIDKYGYWPHRIVTTARGYWTQGVGPQPDRGRTVVQWDYDRDDGALSHFSNGMEGPSYCTHHEYMANARLIAAAPELLAACEALVAVVRMADAFDEILQAERAIAKAKGEDRCQK